MREKRIEFRKYIIKLLGGACLKCGYDEHHAALHVDHVEPLLRKGGVNDGISEFQLLVNHLKKHGTKGLQLLCARCHAIKSYEERHKYPGYLG